MSAKKDYPSAWEHMKEDFDKLFRENRREFKEKIRSWSGVHWSPALEKVAEQMWKERIEEEGFIPTKHGSGKEGLVKRYPEGAKIKGETVGGRFIKWILGVKE